MTPLHVYCGEKEAFYINEWSLIYKTEDKFMIQFTNAIYHPVKQLDHNAKWMVTYKDRFYTNVVFDENKNKITPNKGTITIYN